MKNDIEKMKAEFEAKLQLAIEENEILDRLGDDTLKVRIDNHSYLNKSKKSLTISPDDYKKELTAYQVGMILCKFSSTEKVCVDKHNTGGLMLDYDLSTSRDYNSTKSELHIWYTSGEYDVSIRLNIEDCKELSGFFADGMRRIDPIEIRTHYVVSRPGRKAADVQVPIKVFANGEYIRYKMGHVRSTSDFAIKNIIDTLKEIYLKITDYEK